MNKVVGIILGLVVYTVLLLSPLVVQLIVAQQVKQEKEDSKVVRIRYHNGLRAAHDPIVYNEIVGHHFKPDGSWSYVITDLEGRKWHLAGAIIDWEQEVKK